MLGIFILCSSVFLICKLTLVTFINSARLHLRNEGDQGPTRNDPGSIQWQGEDAYSRNNQPQTLKACGSHRSTGLNHQHKKTTRLLLGWGRNLGLGAFPDEVQSQELPKPILQVKRPYGWKGKRTSDKKDTHSYILHNLKPTFQVDASRGVLSQRSVLNPRRRWAKRKSKPQMSTFIIYCLNNKNKVL